MAWVTDKVFELFEISKETVSSLREELGSLKAERDQLRTELVSTKIMSDWLRVQVNMLQFERTALLEKAYGIKLPAPEIARQPVNYEPPEVNEHIFEDIGEDLAKKLGLPLYGN